MGQTTVLKYSEEDKRNARKGGFKKKRPKKPKSKTHASITSYIKRYNQWVKDLKEAAKKGRELDSLKDKMRDI